MTAQIEAPEERPQPPKQDDERKFLGPVTDLKEELEKSGFAGDYFFDLVSYANYGTEELRRESKNADAFDRQAVEHRIGVARTKIALKVFVAEYDYLTYGVDVNGNESSFTMTTMNLAWEGPKIDTSKLRTVAFPVANVTCDVAKIKFETGAGFTRIGLSLPVNGNTDSIRELVRNSKDYRARIVFTIPLQRHLDGPIFEVQKIEIVKVK